MLSVYVYMYVSMYTTNCRGQPYCTITTTKVAKPEIHTAADETQFFLVSFGLTTENTQTKYEKGA